MDIFLFVLIGASICYALLRFAKSLKGEESLNYDTIFVRGDVRCIMNKITYASQLEIIRKKLEHDSSKF